jgi:hypothetical protein
MAMAAYKLIFAGALACVCFSPAKAEESSSGSNVLEILKEATHCSGPRVTPTDGKSPAGVTPSRPPSSARPSTTSPPLPHSNHSLANGLRAPLRC